MNDSVTTGLSYSASGTTILYGWLTAQNIGVLVGIICAVLTLLANVWAKKRRDRRDEEFHRARMAALRDRALGQR